ncbi:Hsp20/alpha crystallin family protein [Jejudonia soesokkakensis]|uniref:Hsp20/alpha crystallin family protein n=1 Tax=Jejudonia soesokkakensis TaxID=1323432 RepID=A0ABW2MVI0_9FLAO
MKLVKRNNGFLPSIFDELFLENRLDVPNYENFSSPKVNIKENNTNFIIEVAAPGLEKENFEVAIEEDQLSVSYKTENISENNSSETAENTKFTHKEFNFSKFTRSFTLPDTINKEDIKASYVQGILSISLEKVEEKKEIKRMVEIS